MRSILAKIIGLLLAFNLALWAFFLATDDFITNEVRQIKNQLTVTANLYAKITEPILSNITLTDFEKKVTLQELLTDSKLMRNENLRIFRFENKDNLEAQFKYFDGNEELTFAPKTITVLPEDDAITEEVLQPALIQSNELLNRNCSPPETLALAHSRQNQRIVRPLVLGTLFRASSFRSRGVSSNERKRCLPSGEEALSPLRLSI